MLRLSGWTYFLIPLVSLIIGFAVIAHEPRLVQGLRLAVFDTYQRLHPREYTPLPVTVVDIDEESLRRVGQWPWPRTLLARLVDRLHDAGVLVVGLDFIFAEPDRTSPDQVLSYWADSELVRLLRARAADVPDHDTLFAQSLARVPAVGGFVLTGEASGQAPAPLWQVDVDGGDALPALPRFDGIVSYLPELQAALAGAGSFNLISDADGVARRLHLLYALNGAIQPSFAAELLRVAQQAAGYQVQLDADGGIAAVKIGALRVPTDGQGRVWLHYTQPQPQRSVSAWQVLDDGFDASALAQHIVVLGSSAAGLKDLRATPLDRASAGVMLHVALLEQALLGEFLLRPAWAEPAEYLYALALALVLLVLLRHLSAIGCAALGAIAVLAAVVFSWFAYTRWGWLVDPVLPSLAALLVYLVATTINYLRVEGERRQIRNAFGHYLAPQVVEQLTANPGMLKLGGEKRETTFLFSDVAGFTTLTEKLEAPMLVHLLNAYLDEACRIVLEHGGTIDKIVGDALHVMFNAPSDQPDHAERAVRCALALDAFCQRFIAEQKQQGLDVGVTRIGINTGVTVVGNFGGAARFDYTAHGDAINTAARLEGVNKYLGTRTCVSETTRARCQGLRFRPVADLVLKGKSEALGVFEPILDGHDEAHLHAYEQAFAAMRAEAPDAAERFAALHARYPNDPLAAFHARRLAAGERGVHIVMADK